MIQITPDKNIEMLLEWSSQDELFAKLYISRINEQFYLFLICKHDYDLENKFPHIGYEIEEDVNVLEKLDFEALFKIYNSLAAKSIKNAESKLLERRLNNG